MRRAFAHDPKKLLRSWKAGWVHRFSEEIMRQQRAKARWHQLKPPRLSACHLIAMNLYG
jgi:hypothetical protein